MPNRSDTFDRASPSTLGTPSDGGSAWEQLSGTGGVSANQATMLSGATATAVLESGLANVTVQYRAANPSGSSPAAVVRATDAGNYLRVYFLPGFRGHVYKREGGAEVQLAAGNTGPVAAGDICTVECVGNRVTSKVNGVVMATATTGFNAAATKHGLATQTNDTTSKFDDFSISLLTSVTPDRAKVLTGSSGTVTLSLVGTDTTWAGAPFALSGSPPAGWTIAAQTVTSATTATVTLTRGTGTGALTLADGTASATLAATDTATSVATGDWSAGASWDTREVPGAAHDAVVAAGHAVTVDAPAVVDDITVSATGTLVVGAGQSLTADVMTVGNAVLQVGEDGGGAALVFGSLSIGGNGQTNARFRTRGGGGSVTSPGGTLTVTDGTLDIQGTGTFVGLGGVSADAVTLALVSGGAGLHIISGWTFDGCGRVNTTNNLPASRGVSVTGCTFKSPTNAGGISLRLVGSAPSAGVPRVIDRNGLDGGLMATEGAFAVTHNYLGQGFQGPLSSTWAAGQFDGNFCRLTGLSGTGISGMIISGPVDGIYVLGDAGMDNPHLVRPRNTGAPTTFANGIVEYTSTVITDGGNWFYAANAADWTVDRCLTVFSPNIVGGSPGAVTFANLTCRVTNCTLVSGQYSGGILAGDGAAVAGTYPEVRDNIFWTDTGTACYGVSAVGHLGRGGGDPVRVPPQRVPQRGVHPIHGELPDHPAGGGRQPPARGRLGVLPRPGSERRHLGGDPGQRGPDLRRPGGRRPGLPARRPVAHCRADGLRPRGVRGDLRAVADGLVHGGGAGGRAGGAARGGRGMAVVPRQLRDGGRVPGSRSLALGPHPASPAHGSVVPPPRRPPASVGTGSRPELGAGAVPSRRTGRRGLQSPSSGNIFVFRATPPLLTGHSPT